MAVPGARSLRRSRLSNLALGAIAALTIAATPSPSPALGSLLAAAPAGFVEDTESAGTPIGEFDQGAYVSYLSPDDPAATTTALQRDGFVRGFGKSWTHQETRAGFAEIVVAFGGGRGARAWLESTRANARQDQYYQGDLSVEGVGAYVGVRYADPSSGARADVISFVKGNDFFLVGFVSGADMADAAVSQARVQYDFAAAESIPRSEWPENPRPTFPLPYVLAALGVAALIVLAGVAVFVVRSGRRPAYPTSGL
jgi:hypothetical protein